MQKFTVAAVPGGHAVCRVGHDGALIALAEHGYRDSAEAHAELLNAVEAASATMGARARYVAKYLAAQRRCVRYFEADGNVRAEAAC